MNPSFNPRTEPKPEPAEQAVPVFPEVFDEYARDEEFHKSGLPKSG